MKKVLYVVMAYVCLSHATAAQSSSATQSTNKKPENMNKQRVRNLYEDCLNKRKLDQLTNYFSDEYKGRTKTGAAGFEEAMKPLIESFPDIQWTIEDLVAEDDNVVVRWNWKGFHKYPFNGYPATQKEITSNAMAIYRFKDGKIIAATVVIDRLGFLQQTGVVSPEIGNPRK